MIKYELYTNLGQKKYEIDENNNIKNENLKEFSNNWKLIGFIKKRCIYFHNIITIEDFMKLEEKDKYYKNGKCKYYVVDKDYGTTRIWSCGNEIYFVKEV